MKSYDSRTYSINDFVEWDGLKQLVLNPKFQRRSVWTEKAKSYLIDTILRGKPIPKVFIRQQINVTTKQSIREVVDGQQRLRTILSYIKDGFVVSKRHHPQYGGKPFSQLSEDVQAQLLSYEISVDLLINLPDAEVLDIFSRLNAYAVVLNAQEKINAANFGPFKTLADQIGHKYNEYWQRQGILTANEILRMKEITLVADLLIAMIEGIKNNKQIAPFYKRYEKEFDHDTGVLAEKFDAVVAKISELYPESLGSTEYRKPYLYYSLFTAVYHCLFELPGCGEPQRALTGESLQKARNALEAVDSLFNVDDDDELSKEQRQFLQDSDRATTDEAVRKRRTAFILNHIA
jgi:Protein of unknown function DUF262